MINKKGFIGSVLAKTPDGMRAIGILREIGGRVTLCKRINVNSGFYIIPFQGTMQKTIGLDEYILGNLEGAEIPRYPFIQILIKEWDGEQRCLLVDRKTFVERSIKDIQPKTERHPQKWFLPLAYWKEVKGNFEDS